jgi:sarcosine oxidase
MNYSPVSRTSFDVAVLGLGTMGAFACREIARRKASVIGFDRFAPPHNRGSHSGDTRVYREAYAEHPDYVPIARRAGQLWDDFGREAGSVLLHRSGMLSVGAEDSPLLSGVRESATRHALEVERLAGFEIRTRFPAFDPPAGVTGLFEPAAGWIDVNAALDFGIAQARRHGAEIRLHTTVERCTRDGPNFRLHTTAGMVNSARLVITAGAWTSSFLQEPSLPLRVLRKVLIWIDPLEPELFRPDKFPVFAFADRFFYGFPNVQGNGVKLAIHMDPSAPATQPDFIQPPVESSEIEPVLVMAATYMPRLAGHLPQALDRVLATRTCLYTMTPDEHFIIDHHPWFENIWIAAGFSGHGFKFAPAIGEALADLALDGSTALPIEFLRIGDRFTGSHEPA